MTSVAARIGQPIPTFEPKIVAFVCKWCTYAGADLAGTSRMTYPPNVRVLMLPCTGRIDVTFVVRAFLQGADGVLVSGCHPGDCHYTAGNYRARRRWTLLRDLLDTLGFDMDRLELAWISAAEGAKWVRTITAFTDKIRAKGAYEAMSKVIANHASDAAPPAAARHIPIAVAPSAGEEDPALSAAVAEAIEGGKVKAVIGWKAGKTLDRKRPGWITTNGEAAELVAPGEGGNLARMLKNPQIKSYTPVGIVARREEMLAMNVLIQEAQLDPSQVVIFAYADGKFAGAMDYESARKLLCDEQQVRIHRPDEPVGFSDRTLGTLDEVMAMTPSQRWAYWTEQFERCIKCYACRGACPMCNCEQCIADKNQPQWLPTAADGPGDLAWHIIRAFHLAGRCVGCGACEAACPQGIPLNVLGAAMARSAAKNFDHLAGVDPKAQPLQAAFRPDDKDEFIL